MHHRAGGAWRQHLGTALPDRSAYATLGMSDCDRGARKHGVSMIEASGLDMLYLMGRALAGEQAADARVEQMGLEAVFTRAEANGVAALCYFALEGLPLSGHDKLLFRWRAQRDGAIRRQMLFDSERKRVQEALEGAGIWSAPLKGAVIAGMYPRLGMREMVDNDILVDAARIDHAGELMGQMGYALAARTRRGNNDEYLKPPIFCFELHRGVHSSASAPSVAAYFADVDKRLIASDEHPLARRMSNEDLYAHVLSHAWRHHTQRGTGVRALADLCVLKRALVGLDFAYCDEAFARMGIDGFARTISSLAEKVFREGFSPYDLGREEAQLLERLIADGFYGSYENHVEHLLEEAKRRGWSKGRYLLSRAFPPDAWYQENAPFAWRHA